MGSLGTSAKHEGAIGRLAAVGSVLNGREESINLRSIDGQFISRFFPQDTAADSFRIRKLFGYGQTEGAAELRSLVAQLTSLRAEDIVITDGASQAVWLWMVTSLHRGDRLLVPHPVFPAYLRLAACRECSCEYYAMRADGADLLSKLVAPKGPPPSAVIINSPHNPTGLTLDPAICEQILDCAARVDCFVVFDDAHAWLDPSVGNVTRLGKFAAGGGGPPRVAAVGSLGKSLCLPGLRLGFLASRSRALRDAAVEAKRHLAYASCPASEDLAAALLASSEWSAARQRVRTMLQERRLIFDRIARSLGAEPVMNGSGFYTYVTGSARLASADIDGVPGATFEGDADSARYCLASADRHWARFEALSAQN